MDTRKILREFVVKELNRQRRGSGDNWGDGDSLFLSKATDSLFFVDLILFLESRFSLKLSSAEIAKEDLDSIDKMVALIDEKR